MTSSVLTTIQAADPVQAAGTDPSTTGTDQAPCCTRCLGYGFVEEMIGDAITEEVCPKCDGEGYVSLSPVLPSAFSPLTDGFETDGFETDGFRAD